MASTHLTRPCLTLPFLQSPLRSPLRLVPLPRYHLSCAPNGVRVCWHTLQCRCLKFSSGSLRLLRVLLMVCLIRTFWRRLLLRLRRMHLCHPPCPWLSWPSLVFPVSLAVMLRRVLPVLLQDMVPPVTSPRVLWVSLWASARPLLLRMAVVSASAEARVGLLLPILRVSGSRSHIHV